jgi:hypothetical protein
VERNVLASASLLPVASRSRYSVVGSADFNGDGRSDVVLRHRYGDVLLLYMNGYQASGGRLLRNVPESLEGVGLESLAND